MCVQHSETQFVRFFLFFIRKCVKCTVVKTELSVLLGGLQDPKYYIRVTDYHDHMSFFKTNMYIL